MCNGCFYKLSPSEEMFCITQDIWTETSSTLKRIQELNSLERHITYVISIKGDSVEPTLLPHNLVCLVTLENNGCNCTLLQQITVRPNHLQKYNLCQYLTAKFLLPYLLLYLQEFQRFGLGQSFTIKSLSFPFFYCKGLMLHCTECNLNQHQLFTPKGLTCNLNYHLFTKCKQNGD